MAEDGRATGDKARVEARPGPDPMPLLVAEYQYIGQTAFQANEDRARVSQLFFLTFGTLIAALYSSQLSPERVDPSEVQRAFVFLFFTLLLFSLLTLLQMARLRLAWLESVRAMAVLKEAATRDHPGLLHYFAWTRDERPAPLKPKSVGFLMAVSVAWMGALAAGGVAAFLGLLDDPGQVAWERVLASGALSFLGLLSAYAYPLRRAAGDGDGNGDGDGRASGNENENESASESEAAAQEDPA